jgi:hypothetical protein
MPTVGKTARVTSRKKPGRPPLGRVKAIVAVTGVIDEVGDIIVPGVFGPALAKRWPKAGIHHEMKDIPGRVESAEEWLPGDERLPDKQPNGLPWPDEAGALVVEVDE